MRVRTLFIYCLLPWVAHGAQTWHEEGPTGFSADATLSSAKISVNDMLRLEADLKYPDTYSPDFDTLRMNVLKYVGLSEPPFALDSDTAEPLPGGGTKVVFLLDPQLSGIQFLSLYNIRFLPKNPEKDPPVEIISGIFEVEISVPNVPEGFEGESYPLLPLSDRFPVVLSMDNKRALFDAPEVLRSEEQRNASIVKEKTLPWAGLAGGGLFLFILLLARMLPPEKPDEEIATKQRAITARKKALEALATMEESPPEDTRGCESYYVSLTETVRGFIEENFQIKASRQTTSEFLFAAASHPAFDPKTQQMLHDFLTRADRVKFAEEPATAEQCLEAWRMAKKFIENP